MPDYLSHQFHLATGVRLMDYINRTRVAHAKELLTATSLSVNEAAWASGYQDPGYFIRVFRRLEGVTPRVWRHHRPAESA